MDQYLKPKISGIREAIFLVQKMRRESDIQIAATLKTKGYSIITISQAMDKSESTVRALLAKSEK